MAAANGVALEITARGGHNMTNGHIARVAQLTGVRLLVNTDTHTPGDMMDQARAWQVARGAGLTEAEAEAALGANPQAVVTRALRPLKRTI